MKKMYYASQQVDVCFVLEEDDPAITNARRLKDKAQFFLEEESHNHVEEKFILREVKSLTDVPKDWWSCLYWGDNDNDSCVMDFIQDPEYQTYLRLKAKFE